MLDITRAIYIYSYEDIERNFIFNNPLFDLHFLHKLIV